MPKTIGAEEVVDSPADTPISKDQPPCRTHPLVPAFSICLQKQKFCPHALSFGHQYLCRHPGHLEFQVTPPRVKK